MDTIDSSPADAPAPLPPAPEVQNPMAAIDTPLSMRDMMEAGVHFGHQTTWSTITARRTRIA